MAWLFPRVGVYTKGSERLGCSLGQGALRGKLRGLRSAGRQPRDHLVRAAVGGGRHDVLLAHGVLRQAADGVARVPAQPVAHAVGHGADAVDGGHGEGRLPAGGVALLPMTTEDEEGEGEKEDDEERGGDAQTHGQGGVGHSRNGGVCFRERAVRVAAVLLLDVP